MAGIRAEKGFKVSKTEFPANNNEFPSPIWIFREFFLYKKSELGDGNSSQSALLKPSRRRLGQKTLGAFALCAIKLKINHGLC